MQHPMILAAVATVLVSACGGGNGGSGGAAVASPPVIAPTIQAGPTVPIEAAISSLYASAHTFNRTETDPRNGNIYNVAADFIVGADAIVDGLSVKSSNVVRAITKNGAPFQSSSEIRYFSLNPYRLIGIQSRDSSLYLAASGQVPLPATGKPGDAGVFYSATTYDSVGKNIVLSTETQRWTIDADTPTTVRFCINSVTSIATVAGNVSKSDCYKIDSQGNVVGIGFTVPG